MKNKLLYTLTFLTLVASSNVNASDPVTDINSKFETFKNNHLFEMSLLRTVQERMIQGLEAEFSQEKAAIEGLKCSDKEKAARTKSAEQVHFMKVESLRELHQRKVDSQLEKYDAERERVFAQYKKEEDVPELRQGNYQHMEVDGDKHLLIVGCRPWDDNIQEVQGLQAAHFIDFMISGAPTDVPATFHHLDVNDKGAYTQGDKFFKGGASAGSLSEFADKNVGKFKAVVFDWITWGKVKKRKTWGNFAKLLEDNGKFILPVTSSDSMLSASKLKDEEFSELYATVAIHKATEIPEDYEGRNLHMGNRGENGFKGFEESAVVIIATK